MWWVGGGKGEIKQTLIQLEAARLLDLHFVLIPKIVWTFPHFPHNAEMEGRIEKNPFFTGFPKSGEGTPSLFYAEASYV